MASSDFPVHGGESRSFSRTFICPPPPNITVFSNTNPHLHEKLSFQKVIFDTCIWFLSIFQQALLPAVSLSANRPGLPRRPGTERNPFLCRHSIFSEVSPSRQEPGRVIEDVLLSEDAPALPETTHESCVRCQTWRACLSHTRVQTPESVLLF